MDLFPAKTDLHKESEAASLLLLQSEVVIIWVGSVVYGALPLSRR